MAAGDFEGRLWQRKMGVRKRPDHACFTKWSWDTYWLVRLGLSANSSSKILDERLLAERGYYYWAGSYLFIIIDYKRIRDSWSKIRKKKRKSRRGRKLTNLFHLSGLDKLLKNKCCLFFENKLTEFGLQKK